MPAFPAAEPFCEVVPGRRHLDSGYALSLLFRTLPNLQRFGFSPISSSSPGPWFEFVEFDPVAAATARRWLRNGVSLDLRKEMPGWIGRPVSCRWDWCWCGLDVGNKARTLVLEHLKRLFGQPWFAC